MPFLVRASGALHQPPLNYFSRVNYHPIPSRMANNTVAIAEGKLANPEPSPRGGIGRWVEES